MGQHDGKAQGFAAACKDFFGTQPGQSLMEFQKELKALTQADKEEIRTGLIQIGYTVNELVAAPAAA